MVDEEVDLYLVDAVVAATNSPGEADNSKICIIMAVAVETTISMIAGVIKAKVEDQQPITTIITIITIILKAVPREATMKLVVTIITTTTVEDHNGDGRKP